VFLPVARHRPAASSTSATCTHYPCFFPLPAISLAVGLLPWISCTHYPCFFPLPFKGVSRCKKTDCEPAPITQNSSRCQRCSRILPSSYSWTSCTHYPCFFPLPAAELPRSSDGSVSRLHPLPRILPVASWRGGSRDRTCPNLHPLPRILPVARLPRWYPAARPCILHPLPRILPVARGPIRAGHRSSQPTCIHYPEFFPLPETGLEGSESSPMSCIHYPEFFPLPASRTSV